jgi:serine/threonine protein kinase
LDNTTNFTDSPNKDAAAGTTDTTANKSNAGSIAAGVLIPLILIGAMIWWYRFSPAAALARKNSMLIAEHELEEIQQNTVEIEVSPIVGGSGAAAQALETSDYLEPAAIDPDYQGGSGLHVMEELVMTYSAIDALAVTARKVPRVIPRAQVFIVDTLGGGYFGVVSKGLLDESASGGPPEYLVAVKEVKPSAPAIETTKLLEEAVLMAQVSGHENVVSVIGVVTSDDGGPVQLLVTYCENGSLDDYLTKQKGKAPEWKLPVALGVAKGMEHLAACGFVHRDLAARNVLIDSRKRARIADFGMSRDGGAGSGNDADADNVYQSVTGGALPVRWTAPEAFVNHTFTTASDVWSFGVLLLEIWQDGSKPYPTLRNNEVILKLAQGWRAPQPDACPADVYAVMIQCWNNDPAIRPTFLQLSAAFDNMHQGKPVVLLLAKPTTSAGNFGDTSDDYDMPDGFQAPSAAHTTATVGVDDGAYEMPAEYNTNGQQHQSMVNDGDYETMVDEVKQQQATVDDGEYEMPITFSSSTNAPPEETYDGFGTDAVTIDGLQGTAL